MASIYKGVFSLKFHRIFVSYGPIDNNPFSEAMMTRYFDTCMFHKLSIS